MAVPAPGASKLLNIRRLAALSAASRCCAKALGPDNKKSIRVTQPMLVAFRTWPAMLVRARSVLFMLSLRPSGIGLQPPPIESNLPLGKVSLTSRQLQVLHDPQSRRWQMTMGASFAGNPSSSLVLRRGIGPKAGTSYRSRIVTSIRLRGSWEYRPCDPNALKPPLLAPKPSPSDS